MLAGFGLKCPRCGASLIVAGASSGGSGGSDTPINGRSSAGGSRYFGDEIDRSIGGLVEGDSMMKVS